MARKLRFAALAALVLSTLVLAVVGGGYYAARQVRPFYEQALRIEPAVLEQGSRELESRATALYSDAKQAGKWRALFTADQINGWLATQLAANPGNELPANIQDPRIAIGRDVFTLGFRTSSGGVETVISVDASASVTEDGAVAIQLISIRAGTLPLPVLQLADELAEGCQRLKLPIRWTRQAGKPVALVEIRTKEPVYVDAIQLDDGQLYVAGHTENEGAPHRGELSEYQLKLSPKSEDSGLEIARRPSAKD